MEGRPARGAGRACAVAGSSTARPPSRSASTTPYARAAASRETTPRSTSRRTASGSLVYGSP
ncbi:hypothetical protein [Nonomuraea sp. JJY05]|uniref:hypothetical protein n=1 Tax=Nonomuraea sp. JJY05 TaxID=3350255 RepID=UPI00373EC1D8